MNDIILNTDYDFASQFYYQVIYQLTEKWIGKIQDADERLYCSEYTAWILNLNKWWAYTPDSFLKNKNFIQIYNNFN